MLQEAESPPALVSDFVLVSTFMYPEEYTLTENIGEITHVTSFSLYFLGTPIFSHAPPTPLPPPPTPQIPPGTRLMKAPEPEP